MINFYYISILLILYSKYLFNIFFQKLELTYTGTNLEVFFKRKKLTITKKKLLIWFWHGFCRTAPAIMSLQYDSPGLASLSAPNQPPPPPTHRWVLQPVVLYHLLPPPSTGLRTLQVSPYRFLYPRTPDSVLCAPRFCPHGEVCSNDWRQGPFWPGDTVTKMAAKVRGCPGEQNDSIVLKKLEINYCYIPSL